jgi:mRNA-degrading endonuclease RelE of RelBE toxin-antitoxin system
MIFVGTPVFTKRVLGLLADDEYRELQLFLNRSPEAGDVIPGSHGLRKVRWAMSGKGKRGGIRIIYYWITRRNIILMLFVFRKGERSDLTAKQIRILKEIASKELA